ncbi:Chaperone SurA precursor [compost metagenome]
MSHIRPMFNFQKPIQSAKHALILLGLTCGVVAHVQAQGQATAAVQPRLADAIIVVVNNEVITRYDFLERYKMIEARLQSQGGTLPPRDQLQRQLLERMIVERAQLQQAKESGIKIDDTMLDRAMARIADQNKLTMPEFRKRLEEDGLVYSKFRNEIRDEMAIQRLREREVDNKVQVSDVEIDTYMAAQNAPAATAPQELHIAQILIRVPENATPQQLADSKRRADEVVAQLKAGADFTKLASAYSDGTDGLTGGELGWRSAERLPQLFVDATANLQDGQIAPIVKSGNGFHILKLLGRRTQSVMRGAQDGSAPAAKPDAAAVRQTHASHILIKVTQVVSAADARRKLVELKQRLDNKAATFEELAKLYSNDFSAAKGGDLGWIYPGDTVPEFERAMDALPIGQVSEPIESPFGYHLILVTERKSDDVSQERQRMAARQAIREQKVEEATQDWLRQVRDRAYVEYRLDDPQ